MFTKLSKTLTEAINASPNVDELCAFGQGLPEDLRTIVISSTKRQERARRSSVAACLPNVQLVQGYAPFAREEDVPEEARAKLGSKLFVNGCRLRAVDFVCVDGVVHTIDCVLQPNFRDDKDKFFGDTS